MTGPIFVDSTVIARLALDGPGSDFALSLFARAERGEELLVTDTLAVAEAASKVMVAAASEALGTHDYHRVAEALWSDREGVREAALQKLETLISYLDRLRAQARLQVVAVGSDDLVSAVEIAKELGIRYTDAIHASVIRRFRLSRVASFSEHLRRLPGVTLLPPKL